MIRWFLAAYMAWRLTLNLTNDWTLKIRCLKAWVYDFEADNSLDFRRAWTFRVAISFPHPIIIIESREGYDLAREIWSELKSKGFKFPLIWY